MSRSQGSRVSEEFTDPGLGGSKEHTLPPGPGGSWLECRPHAVVGWIPRLGTCKGQPVDTAGGGKQIDIFSLSPTSLFLSKTKKVNNKKKSMLYHRCPLVSWESQVSGHTRAPES